MNSDQFQAWLQSMADGLFGFLNYAAANLTTVAIGAVVGLLVLALLIGLLGRSVRKRRLRKEARKAAKEAARLQDRQ